MAYIIDDKSYLMSEAEVDDATGAFTTTGSIALTGLQPGTVVLAAHYVESSSTWKFVILSPQ